MVNGQNLYEGTLPEMSTLLTDYSTRPTIGRRYLPRKKGGLTGDDYADILKSKAFLKMDPLQQMEIYKMIQEMRGLKAEEHRAAEAHRKEMETQERAKELEENIRNILVSDRTPAQKAIALWHNLGIPKKQANAMVWGERPEGEAEERVPTRREQKLAAIGRGEDVTGRLPGTLIGKPPTERFPLWSTPEQLKASEEHARGLREAEAARREGRIQRMDERAARQRELPPRKPWLEEKFPVWSSPEDIRAAAEHAKEVRGVRKTEQEQLDEETKQTRIGGYLEMGANGTWTKDEVIAALMGEKGMTPTEASALTAHLPSREDLAEQRRQKIADIDKAGEELKKVKKEEKATKDAAILAKLKEKRERLEKILAEEKAEKKKYWEDRRAAADALRTPDAELKKQKAKEQKAIDDKAIEESTARQVDEYISDYMKGKINKTELKGLLAGLPGIGVSDAVSLTNGLPSEWEKKKYRDEQSAKQEEAIRDKRNELRDDAFLREQHDDAQEKIDRDYVEAAVIRGEEEAAAVREHKEWRLEQELDIIKLALDAGLSPEFAEAMAGLFRIFDENIEADNRVGEVLDTFIEITNEEQERAVQLYEDTKPAQAKAIDAAIAKEGMTLTSDYKIKMMAIAELGKDIKTLGLDGAVKKWTKPRQWWFQTGKTPFTNRESQKVFREAIEKYAHEATTEGMMGLTEEVILENMTKKSAALVKDIQALAKKKKKVEIPLPTALTIGLTGLPKEVREEAMACYDIIWNDEGAVAEPTATDRGKLITLMCGRTEEDKGGKKEKYHTPEYKATLPVNIESDAEFISLINGTAKLSRKHKGWLYWKRFTPGMWKDFIDTAAARGNYLLPGASVELDAGPTLRERIAGGIQRGIEALPQALMPKILGKFPVWGREEPKATKPMVPGGGALVLPNIDDVADKILREAGVKTQAQLRKRLDDKGYSKVEIDGYFGRMK